MSQRWGIRVSKMTSHCAGAVHMREESESGIRKWEGMWFKMTAEDGKRGATEATVMCDRRLFHRLWQEMLCHQQWTVTVDRRVHRTLRCTDEAEHSGHRASVSAGWCSIVTSYNVETTCMHFTVHVHTVCQVVIIFKHSICDLYVVTSPMASWHAYHFAIYTIHLVLVSW